VQNQLVINGERRAGAGGETFDVLDPSNGDVVASVASGTPDDMIAACDAAAAAQPGWAATPPRTRSELLRSCYQVMVDNAQELASIIVKEHGKPMADALGEIGYAAEFFRSSSAGTQRRPFVSAGRSARTPPAVLASSFTTHPSAWC